MGRADAKACTSMLCVCACVSGCERNVEVWQRVLELRSLVVTKEENREAWLEFATLCRRSGRAQLSHKTLVGLLGTDPQRQTDGLLPTEAHPQVCHWLCIVC